MAPLTAVQTRTRTVIFTGFIIATPSTGSAVAPGPDDALSRLIYFTTTLRLISRRTTVNDLAAITHCNVVENRASPQTAVLAHHHFQRVCFAPFPGRYYFLGIYDCL